VDNYLTLLPCSTMSSPPSGNWGRIVILAGHEDLLVTATAWETL